MSRSLSRWQAIILGVVILAGLGLTAAGLFAVGGRYAPWQSTFDLHAGFPQVRGVEVGTRVRVQGVDAGEVVALRPPTEPGGSVLLTLRLDTRRLGSRELVRTDATARIVGEGMIGGKVIEVDPGTRTSPPAPPGAEIASVPTMELADAMAQAGNILQALDGQKGKVGELLDNTNRLLQKGHDAVSSIQRVSEAVERAPVVGGYVRDPQRLLNPPNSERHARWLAEADLFEPGTDRLTAPGQERLHALVNDVLGLTRHDGAELVVIAFAKDNGDRNAAHTLTRNQSEVVCDYLKNAGAVYKRWYWLSSRKATPLGLGTQRPPAQKGENVPPAGVGVLVFVPQG